VTDALGTHRESWSSVVGRVEQTRQTYVPVEGGSARDIVLELFAQSAGDTIIENHPLFGPSRGAKTPSGPGPPRSGTEAASSAQGRAIYFRR